MQDRLSFMRPFTAEQQVGTALESALRGVELNDMTAIINLELPSKSLPKRSAESYLKRINKTFDVRERHDPCIRAKSRASDS